MGTYIFIYFLYFNSYFSNTFSLKTPVNSVGLFSTVKYLIPILYSNYFASVMISRVVTSCVFGTKCLISIIIILKKKIKGKNRLLREKNYNILFVIVLFLVPTYIVFN